MEGYNHNKKKAGCMTTDIRQKTLDNGETVYLIRSVKYPAKEKANDPQEWNAFRLEGRKLVHIKDMSKENIRLRP